MAFGSVYPVQDTDHVKATTDLGSNYRPWFTTDPAKLLTGTGAGNSWYSTNGQNNRFHIDLGNVQIVTRIYYENSHEIGANTSIGSQNFTFWGSNTAGAFTTLTYATDTNWTQLTTNPTAMVQHTASDVADPQYATVTNTTAYRYYAFKLADNYGGTYQAVRRIVLQIKDRNQTIII